VVVSACYHVVVYYILRDYFLHFIFEGVLTHERLPLVTALLLMLLSLLIDTVDVCSTSAVIVSQRPVAVSGHHGPLHQRYSDL